MKRVFFLFLYVAYLYGNDSLLDIYRKQGLAATERALDEQLAQADYWKPLIQTNDTRFGYIEKYNSILVCDKSSSSLKLYQRDANNTFVLKNEYHAYTGKNRGEKEHEGDLKTPVGIYHLIKRLSKIDSFYGPMAFVTSYPNLFDRYRNKKGHGIWIHGLPLHQKRDAFTKGCIAIDNDGLECLNNEIDLPSTLLLIYESEEIVPNDTNELAGLAAWLYKWRYAWKYNDIETYLSFYAKNFKRSDGKDLEAFADYKRAIFSRKQKKSIIFDDLNIIPYPNHEGVFQITFFEHYKSDGYSYNGPKELLIKKEGNSYKIFVEK